MRDKWNRFTKGHNLIDLTGQKIAQWTVIRLFSKNKKGRTYFWCRCECGKEKAVLAQNLKNGQSKNCGHDRQSKIAASVRTHGMHDSSEYGIWRGIVDRCTRSKRPEYPLYGGRGIKVCDSWKNSFEQFYKDMGPKPSKKHSIDRIDVNGNYEPANCRWACRSVQGLNKQNAKGVRKMGEKYQARIRKNRKEKVIGYFATYEEAHQAYKTARDELIQELLNEAKPNLI